MFYIEKPETFPRTYELVAELPPVPVGKRWRGYTFAQVDNAFIVHSRMHGTHDKPQPYALRGADKSGRLLVTALVATEYEKIGSWHEVDAEYTTEGYRFKRYALKPLATLIKLASNAAKANARTRKQQAHQADRDEKCGICPCCFGDYVARLGSDTMVHHGYERPGDGMIHGDCYGVGYAPFEISCEGTKFYRGIVHNALLSYQATLAALPTLEVVKVESGSTFRNGRYWPEYKEIKRGEYGFDREIESRRHKLEGQITSATRHLADLDQKIATWKPQKFPRVVKKAKAS